MTAEAAYEGLVQDYAYCRRLAQSHYENFPVASLLLPRAMREPVAVIYAFARTADDLADEGSLPAQQRLAALDAYSRKLERIGEGLPVEGPIFTALADIIQRYDLPLQLFHDLLSAFRQDVGQRRYADFAQLLDYCRRSANPVGRLMLHLSGDATDENLLLSDKVCTALQLINFYQDLAQDYEENDRIYLPSEEMARFEVEERHLAEQCCDAAMSELMEMQLVRAGQLMREGHPLGSRLSGRFGLEIRLIIAGGEAVLKRLAAQRDDYFSRPRLRRRDYLGLLWQALMKR